MILTTISGRHIESDAVEFDSSTYHFLYNSEDITDDLFRADKRTFSGFSDDIENERKYKEKYARDHGGTSAPVVGSTSTLDIFANQILTDPLAAPVDAIDSAVKKLTNSSGIKTLAIVGVLIIAAAIYFKER